MKLEYATGRIKAHKTVVIPSTFFLSVADLPPGCRVVLYARVSTRGQKEHLKDALNLLSAKLRSYGLVVIGTFAEIARGDDLPTSDWSGRVEFEKAVLMAKEADAFLVAEMVDRFIRSRRYYPNRKPYPAAAERFQPLNIFDMKQLAEAADGVRLATLLPPDALGSEVRSEQTKRGLASKANVEDRPVKKLPPKAQRLAYKPKALEMRMAGLPYRQIGQALGVHWSTVRDWIQAENPHTSTRLR